MYAGILLPLLCIMCSLILKQLIDCELRFCSVFVRLRGHHTNSTRQDSSSSGGKAQNIHFSGKSSRHSVRDQHNTQT